MSNGQGTKKMSAGKIVGLLILLAVIYGLKHFGIIDLTGSGDGEPSGPGGTVAVEPSRETGGGGVATGGGNGSATVGAEPADNDGLRELYANGISDEMIVGTGRIVKLLPDDLEGSRHQKFLVEIDRNLTVRVVLNIDLAPYIPCEEGDFVTFKGEYEWTELGGTVHWTHHDPKKWHEEGWIDHKGIRYE